MSLQVVDLPEEAYVRHHNVSSLGHLSRTFQAE